MPQKSTFEWEPSLPTLSLAGYDVLPLPSAPHRLWSYFMLQLLYMLSSTYIKRVLPFTNCVDTHIQAFVVAWEHQKLGCRLLTLKKKVPGVCGPTWRLTQRRHIDRTREVDRAGFVVFYLRGEKRRAYIQPIRIGGHFFHTTTRGDRTYARNDQYLFICNGSLRAYVR